MGPHPCGLEVAALLARRHTKRWPPFTDRWVHHCNCQPLFLWLRGQKGGVLCVILQVSAASPWVWTDGERDEWCLLQSGRLCCGSGTCRCLPGRAWRVPSDLGFFWVACWPASVELPCSRLNRFHSERLRITIVMGLPEKALSSPGLCHQRGAVYCPAVKPGHHHFWGSHKDFNNQQS